MDILLERLYQSDQFPQIVEDFANGRTNHDSDTFSDLLQRYFADNPDELVSLIQRAAGNDGANVLQVVLDAIGRTATEEDLIGLVDSIIEQIYPSGGVGAIQTDADQEAFVLQIATLQRWIDQIGQNDSSLDSSAVLQHLLKKGLGKAGIPGEVASFALTVYNAYDPPVGEDPYYREDTLLAISMLLEDPVHGEQLAADLARFQHEDDPLGAYLGEVYGDDTASDNAQDLVAIVRDRIKSGRGNSLDSD